MESNMEASDVCSCGSGTARARCHGVSPIDVRSPDASISYLCIFGFPEFQEKLYESYKEYFVQALPRLRSLAFEMVRRVAPDAGVEAAVHALAGVALATHLEVVLLAGNGLGFGAAKGVRSILECLFIVEYLILHPEEAERRQATAAYSSWKMLDGAKERGLDLLPFRFNEDELREKHGAAKERFKSLQWKFGEIAKKIGREEEYDTIYKTLSELVHSTDLAVSLRAEKAPGSDRPVIVVGACDEFCNFSLYLSHKFLIAIFEAVNRLFGLDFSAQLASALSELEKAWQGH